MVEGLEVKVDTDIKCSCCRGRNGVFNIKRIELWIGASGVVYVEGIGKRNMCLNGGFAITVEAMDELAKKWLEARRQSITELVIHDEDRILLQAPIDKLATVMNPTPEPKKSTPSNCVLPSCKFNTIPPGENSQECVGCEGNGKKVYIHVSGGVVDEVCGPTGLQAVIIDEDNGEADDDTEAENKELQAELEDMKVAGVVVALDQN